MTTSELPVTNITVYGKTEASGDHRHSISTAHDESSNACPQPAYGNNLDKVGYTDYAGTHTHTFTGTGRFGEGVAHNVMQPYTVVYRWRRTA